MAWNWPESFTERFLYPLSFLGTTVRRLCFTFFVSNLQVAFLDHQRPVFDQIFLSLDNTNFTLYGRDATGSREANPSGHTRSHSLVMTSLLPGEATPSCHTPMTSDLTVIHHFDRRCLVPLSHHHNCSDWTSTSLPGSDYTPFSAETREEHVRT